jgi:uncharacterized protein (DUF1786 family)
MDKGFKVFMNEETAFTLYNRIDRVKALGIRIMEKAPERFNGEHMTLDEIGINQFKSFFTSFSETLEDLNALAIAVQDHGVPPENVNQNMFRLNKFKEYFSLKPEIHDSVFSEAEIPECYVRMRSAVRSAKKALLKTGVFIMDSTIAAIAGCLRDRIESGDKTITAVNIGNSHVTAGLIRDNRIVGFMEHHTSVLRPKKLERFLTKLQSGTLTDEEIIADGGHGAFYMMNPVIERENVILVTGPQRMMMKKTGLKSHFAAPSGDVMMTGVFGLVKAVETKLGRSMNI